MATKLKQDFAHCIFLVLLSRYCKARNRLDEFDDKSNKVQTISVSSSCPVCFGWWCSPSWFCTPARTSPRARWWSFHARLFPKYIPCYLSRISPWKVLDVDWAGELLFQGIGQPVDLLLRFALGDDESLQPHYLCDVFVVGLLCYELNSFEGSLHESLEIRLLVSHVIRSRAGL